MQAEPPKSTQINDTWLRRILTLTAVKIYRHIRSRRRGSVLFLSRKLCVKYGYFQDVTEAATMQFIAQNTSIPVPKVYCTFKRNDMTYIVMERLEGDYIGNGWYMRTKESREHILRQLKKMVDEMRRIPCPANGGVASVDGGTLYDCRLPNTLGKRRRFGPFKDIPEFHRWLRSGFEAHPDHVPDISELIRLQDDGTWSLCFTHADLSSLNILARGDDVVGIIDWETSGWYPDYWEYTTAWNVNPQNEFWRNEVDHFLEPRPKALAMERIRMQYFGDY